MNFETSPNWTRNKEKNKIIKYKCTVKIDKSFEMETKENFLMYVSK